MKKISFDFDSVLDNKHIQEFVKELVKDFDVHIVTSRPEIPKFKDTWNNDDLYEVSDNLGIDRDNIHFTEYDDKFKFFLNHPDFTFHLDDDLIEIEFINDYSDVIGILFDDGWKENCLKYLKYEKRVS